MYFSEEARARMMVDAFMLGVFRLLSCSPPVRMQVLGLLEEQIIPSFEKQAEGDIMVTLVKAVADALTKDAERDASKALDAALSKAIGEKELLPQ